MLNEVISDIEKFVDRLVYMEVEREQILKETLAFVGSMGEEFDRGRVLKLAKQKALEMADELIQKNC